MNISQAAKLTGLSAKQIRDYEKLGLLKPSARTLAGYRHYEESDLKRLHFIRHSGMWAFLCNKSPNCCNYKTTRNVTAAK